MRRFSGRPFGEAEGGDAPGSLARDGQRLATGRQHAHARAVAQQALDQGATGRQQVLAVIQHEQEPFGTERRRQGVDESVLANAVADAMAKQ